MTGDLTEKYYRINIEFPSLAGKLDQTVKAQRRLIEQLSKNKHSEEIKSLIVSVAVSIEASEALIAYTHNMLMEVGKDCEALIEGSKVRNQLRWNSELLGELLARGTKIEQLILEIRENMAKK